MSKEVGGMVQSRKVKRAGVSNATRSARGVRATSRRVAQTCVQETGCGTQFTGPTAWADYLSALEAATPTIEAIAVYRLLHHGDL